MKRILIFILVVSTFLLITCTSAFADNGHLYLGSAMNTNSATYSLYWTNGSTHEFDGRGTVWDLKIDQTKKTLDLYFKTPLVLSTNDSSMLDINTGSYDVTIHIDAPVSLTGRQFGIHCANSNLVITGKYKLTVTNTAEANDYTGTGPQSRPAAIYIQGGLEYKGSGEINIDSPNFVGIDAYPYIITGSGHIEITAGKAALLNFDNDGYNLPRVYGNINYRCYNPLTRIKEENVGKFNHSSATPNYLNDYYTLYLGDKNNDADVVRTISCRRPEEDLPATYETMPLLPVCCLMLLSLVGMLLLRRRAVK